MDGGGSYVSQARTSYTSLLLAETELLDLAWCGPGDEPLARCGRHRCVTQGAGVLSLCRPLAVRLRVGALSCGYMPWQPNCLQEGVARPDAVARSARSEGPAYGRLLQCHRRRSLRAHDGAGMPWTLFRSSRGALQSASAGLADIDRRAPCRPPRSTCITRSVFCY